MTWLFALCCLTSCMEDEWTKQSPVQSSSAVRLLAYWPESNGFTKAPGQKTDFAEGDIIQLSAVFTLTDNSITNVYDCMIYRDGEWVSNIPSENTNTKPMEWPWNSVKGDFKAYYLPAVNSVLTQNGSSEFIALADIEDTTDPLYAETKELEYGKAVPLQFKHLCTRLILTNVKNDNVNEFWLQKNDNNILKTAYQLKRDGNDELNFSFVAAADNKSYIARTKDDEEGVVFYLAPGDYSNIKLNYRGNRPYLQIKVDDLKDLKENTSYTLSIIGQQGIIEEEKKGDEWDDEPIPEDLGEIKVQNFMEAIRDGKSYQDDKGNPVLDRTSDGRLILLRSIDFKNGSYPVDLGRDIIFDGDYHYIKNVGGALFKTIQGQVMNLKIQDSEITSNASGTADKEHYFGLLGEFCDNGSIDNIRLKNIKFQVEPGITAAHTYNAGIVVGASRGGSISNIVLESSIEIIAFNKDNLANIFIGGIIGQNAGTLSNVRFGEGGALTVKNQCIGQSGALMTGALVGGCRNGVIKDCKLFSSVDVDAFEAQAVVVRIGGLTGDISEGTVSGCSITGSVKGGAARDQSAGGTVSAGCAHTGGLVGYGESGLLKDCEAINVAITGHDVVADSGDQTTHATGGAIGYTKNGFTIEECHFRGGSIAPASSTDKHFVGGFAGEIATGASLDETQNSTTISSPFVGKK